MTASVTGLVIAGIILLALGGVWLFFLDGDGDFDLFD